MTQRKRKKAEINLSQFGEYYCYFIHQLSRICGDSAQYRVASITLYIRFFFSLKLLYDMYGLWHRFDGH